MLNKESEIEILLRELQNMKQEPSKVFNAREVWDGIAQRKTFKELGFKTEDELKQFLSDNPYNY